MRFAIAIFICFAALFCAGCKTSDEPQFRATVGKGGSQMNAAPRKASAAAPAEAQNTATNKPSVRPVDGLSGRIVAVRESLRFAVIDFATGRMPQLDQRLSVYRLDQKVAELKVSGPYLQTTVAADVIAGEVSVGDFVRDR